MTVDADLREKVPGIWRARGARGGAREEDAREERDREGGPILGVNRHSSFPSVHTSTRTEYSLARATAYTSLPALEFGVEVCSRSENEQTPTHARAYYMQLTTCSNENFEFRSGGSITSLRETTFNEERSALGCRYAIANK